MKLIPNFKKPYVSQIFFHECADRRHIKITMCRVYPKEKDYFKHYIERSYVVKNKYRYSTQLINKYRNKKYSDVGSISFPVGYLYIWFLSPKDKFKRQVWDGLFLGYIILLWVYLILRWIL